MFYIERRQKYHVIAYMLWCSTFFIRLPQTQILIIKSWNIHSIIPSVQHWFTLLPFLVGIVMNQWNFYGCIWIKCSWNMKVPFVVIFAVKKYSPRGCKASSAFTIISLLVFRSKDIHPLIVITYCRLIYSMKYASVNTSIHILLN